MHSLWALLMLGGACDFVCAQRTHDTLVRIKIPTESPDEFANQLESAGYDVLHPEAGSNFVELITSEEERRGFEQKGYRVKLVAKGRPFREIQNENFARGVPQGYPDLATVETAMVQFAADHPAICQLVDLTAAYSQPLTAEGRRIYALKISDNVSAEEDEPSIMLVSAQHSREVVTPVVALHAIEQLLVGYGTDQDITDAVNDNEIWIAPVWNPDGYNHVFEVDNFWRKNRQPFAGEIGVDLNRNYPVGWFTACSGSTDPSSILFKGPSPASEIETQTMLAWTADQRFAKVIDFHTSGQEILWGYACTNHPLETFLQNEAVALSLASGFGDQRPPTADGEHFQTQLAFGAHAFLSETSASFQVDYPLGVAEAALVFPGTMWMIERPIPVSGHVTDAVTGLPVEAEIQILLLNFENGETNFSGGPFGRYHIFLPPGNYDLEFMADGYVSQTHSVTVDTIESAVVLEVQFQPITPQTLDPSQFNVVRGILLEGENSDVINSDDMYLRFNPGFTLNPSEPPVWVEFEAVAPTANLATLDLFVESNANTPGLVGSVEMFDYVSGSFEQIDIRPASFNTDMEIQLDWTNDISRFVEPGTGMVKTRVGWNRNGFLILFPWEVQIDHIEWAFSVTN